MICYEMFNKSKPYEKNKLPINSLIQQIIQNGYKPGQLKSPYSSLNKLMLKCLYPSPSNRPSFATLAAEIDKIKKSSVKKKK